MPSKGLIKALGDRRWFVDRDTPADLWKRINDAWRDLVTLTTQQEKTFQYVTQDFTGPAAAFSFEWRGKRPRAVILGSLYRTDSGATTPVTFAWTFADNTVSSTSFNALAAATWRVSFLVIGGE
jgi:hypothetical protein